MKTTLIEPTKFSECKIAYAIPNFTSDFKRRRIVGKAVHPDGTPFDEIPPKVIFVSKKADVGDARTRIKYEIEKQYNAIYCAEKPGLRLQRDAVECLDNLVDMIEHDGFRLVPRWKAESTNKTAVTYFNSHTLDWLVPFLTGQKEFLAEADSLALEKSIRNAAMESRNSISLLTVDRTVARHMTEAQVIIDYLYRTVDGFPLIQLVYDSTAHEGGVMESIKYIESKVFKQFCHRLYTEAKKHPVEVLCTIIMTHGARTSEAAAVKPCDILLSDDLANVSIFNQEKNGFRSLYLKTEISRRVMVIGYWGTQLIKECIHHMHSDLIHDTSDKTLITSDKLNTWIVNLLRDCGMTESVMQSYESDMLTDAQNNRNERISSYILRRNFATIARNCMGFTFAETNAQLGHKGGCDMRQPDVRQRMTSKINTFTFDVDVQNNPWLNPCDLGLNDEIELLNFSGYKYTNSTSKPLILNLNISSIENGAGISVGINRDNPALDLNRNSERIDWSTIDRALISDTTNWEE